MKKLEYDGVKTFIEMAGYKLLSDNYINVQNHLIVQCDKKHEPYMVKYYNFQQGKRCPHCAGNIKIEYDEVIKEIKNRGYKLVKYLSSRKIKVQCNMNHDPYWTSYISIKTGRTCKQCIGTKKYTLEQVKQYIEDSGYKLLSKIYYGKRKKLTIECNKGHIFKMLLGNFKTGGQRCPQCSYVDGKSKGEREVLEWLKTKYNGVIKDSDRSTIFNTLSGKYLELDIYLPELNKAIEFNSKYYHTGESIENRDKIKNEICGKYNIILYTLWYEDWIKDKQKELNKIQEFINIY